MRWKQGEYQAVWRLSEETKRKFTPLIEVPEIGWDFESAKDAKTIDEHLVDFAEKKLNRKWGQSPCFVDLNLIKSEERMADGEHPIRFVFKELRNLMCMAIPVTGLDRDQIYQNEIRDVLAEDGSRVCLRITLEQAAKITIQQEVDSLLVILGSGPKYCDLIVDLGAPNFIPLNGFSTAIQRIIDHLPYLNDWLSFTILGTSFPETMGGIKKGGNIIPRYEWQLYKILIDNFGKENVRFPSFGDYVINHPEILELDMRLVKPSATIRYTIDNAWFIVKGENVRDYKFGQYRDLSNMILNSSDYRNPDFSWGDEYIEKCGNGSGKTGNLPMWRQVGTNHHIETVTQDISNFYASSNNP